MQIHDPILYLAAVNISRLNTVSLTVVIAKGLTWQHNLKAILEKTS